MRLYRHSSRIADLIGPTGTTIIVRLSAFLLFCIGIQVFWNGASELLGTLPLGSAGDELSALAPNPSTARCPAP